jgi:hypothetical protein
VRGAEAATSSEILEPRPRWAKAREAGILCLVLLATALPRVGGLDQFATVDEPKWLTRSADFFCALAHGRFADTYQSEHPGVTTMWAGTAGLAWCLPEYAEMCPPEVSREEYEGILAANGLEPIDVLAAGRLFMVIGNSLALLLAFVFARRLFGPLASMAGVLLVAFDPFHLAHSRLLHLDGLLSSLMLLAFLAFVSYLRDRRASHLVVSGLAAGLSWLTKAPGLFLVPAVALATLVQVSAEWRSQQPCRLSSFLARSARPLMVWAALAAATMVALWPSMWVAPAASISKMATAAMGYAGEGHSGPVFFNGVVVDDGNLGLSYSHYYLIAYLWRATPVTILGLGAAIAVLAAGERLPSTSKLRPSAGALVLFAAVFALLITVPGKKGDRYLLPVFPVLDILAAVGWATAVRLAGERVSQASRRAVLVVPLAAAIGLQLLSAASAYPYYLSYYNPVVGGGRTATKVLQIGWGEGLDQAGRYLSGKEDAASLRAVSWYNSGCFSYFFAGNSSRLKSEPDQTQMDFQRILNSDYVVTYIHQQQVGLPPELLGFLQGQTPEESIWINGLEYARVYRPTDAFSADSCYSEVGAELGEAIMLLGFCLPRSEVAGGDALPLALYWQSRQAIAERLKVFVHVVDENGGLVAQNDAEPAGWLRPTCDWQEGERVDDNHGVFLPPNLPPGRYELRVGMYRLSGERLPVRIDGEPTGDYLSLADVAVGE